MLTDVMSSGQSWTGSFPGTLAGVIEAGQWIEALGDAERLPQQQCYGIQLCIEELLTNIVRHGGGAWRTGEADQAGPATSLTIEIRISREGEATTVVVEDDGKPFDVAAAPVQRVRGPLDAVEPGGLGILLIKQFSSGLTYDRSGGRNRTTLQFA